MGISNKIMRGALLLICIAISNNLMAANSDSSTGEIIAIVTVVLVLIVLVLGFVYIRKLHVKHWLKQMPKFRSQQISSRL